MRAKQIMTTDVVTVSPDSSVRGVARLPIERRRQPSCLEMGGRTSGAGTGKPGSLGCV